MANHPAVSGEAIRGGLRSLSRIARKSIDSTSAASVVGVLSSETSEGRRSAGRPRTTSSPTSARRTALIHRGSDTRMVKRGSRSGRETSLGDSGASGDRLRLRERSLNPANLVDGAGGRAVCDRTSDGRDRDDRLLSASCAMPAHGTTSADSPSAKKLTTSQNRMQWRFFTRFELAGTEDDRRGSPRRVERKDGPDASRRGMYGESEESVKTHWSRETGLSGAVRT